jgi:hypothetical protein
MDCDQHHSVQPSLERGMFWCDVLYIQWYVAGMMLCALVAEKIELNPS